MPTLNRRSILKGLATAPVGAKQAAKEVAEMAGVGVVGPNESSVVGHGMSVCGTEDNKLLDFVKSYGVPEWRKKEIRKEARYSRTIDPDIAAMKSLSLDAKLRKQWSRNVEKLEQDYIEFQLIDEARTKFFRKFGI